MHTINFTTAKKQFSDQARQDQLFRARVQQTSAGAFVLKEISLTPRAVVLVAANKTIAQELFLRRDEIKTGLGAEYASRELVIR